MPQPEPTTRASRRFWIVLGAITAAALAWRVGYVLYWHFHSPFGARTYLNGDAAYYHWQSNDIANGRWFIDPGQYQFFGRITPSAGHPPNYLLYLAFWAKLGLRSELSQRLVSTLLGAGTVALCGVLARKLFHTDWAGWIAAGLAAVTANLWINDEMLMSEGMYSLTILIALILAYRYWKRASMWSAVWMGVGVAFATNSRAEAVMLFPLLVVPFALLQRQNPWKTRFLQAGAGLLAGFLVLAPWLGFNFTRFEHPVLTTNGTGSVLMVANCDYPDLQIDPSADPNQVYQGTFHGEYVGYWSIYCSANLSKKIDTYFSKTEAKRLHTELGLIPGTDVHFFGDESTHEIAWRAIGIESMKLHKGDLVTVVPLRILRMWDLFRPGQNVGLNDKLEGRGCMQTKGGGVTDCWQGTLALYQYFPQLALGIVGLVLLRKRREWPILPFVAMAGVVTFTAAATFGITRYRSPIDTVLPVLTAGAVMYLVDVVRTIGKPVRTKDDVADLVTAEA